ncbi:MAG: hypothetical protein A2020_16185 [Lentisphaerae bacterium GWF2_45_14]|nr:MAG: hypothetical protein A2020_16185 [Lentisphaerae bacterium GWF2_45_14]
MKNSSRLALFDGAEIVFTQCDAAEKSPLPVEFTVLKYGINEFTKEGQRGSFVFSEADADTVISEFESRGRDIVIDYEHQSISGSPAPAAGWVEKLYKSAEGLCVRVKYWTRKASEFLGSGEYRYFSPVLQFSRRARSVTALHSIALTNHPALHNNPALVADDSAAEEDLSSHNNNSMKGSEMNELFQILKLEAFADSSKEQAVLKIKEAVESLVRISGELNKFLELNDLESLSEASEKIRKNSAEITKLKASEAVKKAFSDGKLSVQLKKWAEDFAGKDLEAFSCWTTSAPVIVPANKTIEGISPAEEENTPDPEKAKIFRNLGIDTKNMKGN